MVVTTTVYEVTWEKLPDDFVLDDEPVDNANQPLLAVALTESLELAGKLPDHALTDSSGAHAPKFIYGVSEARGVR